MAAIASAPVCGGAAKLGNVVALSQASTSRVSLASRSLTGSLSSAASSRVAVKVATTRRVSKSSARFVQPVAALTWVLEPVGDGDCSHLETVVPKPGPVRVTTEAVVIGRIDGRADVVIPVPTVSGVHARVENRGDALVVTDLDSTNGTFVDNAQVQPGNSVVAVAGSVVIFGDQHLACFKVTQVDEPEPVAASEE
eukprot:TRINITY_DN23095_c0_g1_i1.p1 TRINITY_DN23095_c0_g1~~TRINITY_DN23095_c0_g1_i1.p1  ORF type:complete len:225 (+),score=9.96 TRINITY_DN23095_c0_g1_i1:89-676(+)